MTNPSITETTLDGQLGALPPGSGVPYVVIGASTIGPRNLPAAFARKQYLPTNFGQGPLVELGANSIENTAVAAICVRTGNSVAGSAGEAISSADGTCSAVTKTGTGTFTPSINGTHDLPNAAKNVKVIFPVGGELGVTGIVYQISLDGGATYGMAQALGTGR